ncbi:MAG: alpha/beta fold hydrolase [Bacteroidia bacterium]|jgi:dipeptidyl aminopeptidase/acylaminoacyl peptidase|nr:alpha/beta fold hydrolase [Bacteroidia bacterium]
MKKLSLSLLLLLIGLGFQTTAQQAGELKTQFDQLRYRLDALDKNIDDLLWYQKVGDVADIDKVYIYGPPPAKVKKPEKTGTTNPVKFWTYVFTPKNMQKGRKYPLIVLPHGGVHADFTTYYAHIVRELIAQGYVVTAPEYRGSTGYGEALQKQIDYGGLENEDVLAARNHLVDNYPFIDGRRVGIAGWSHGGMIALMNIFDYPDSYQVAYAGVPVSDLIARMGYATDDYRRLFDAEYHIGATARDNVEEYRRRSPAWQAHKLKTPLLIHTTTNDDDVYVIEVEHLIKALKAEGKKFDYEIFQDAPGGHSFDRMDTPYAWNARVKIYKHLARYLKPESPIENVEQLRKAAYRGM